MYDLPLFPLDVVLFPGNPVHLHIFEERYKRMIDMCIHERRSFGVVLIRSGQEALGPLAEPHRVGCMAKIVQVHRLADERMNIVALGKERFQILSTDHQSFPYLMGAVETFPLGNPHPQMAYYQAANLRRQVEKFIQTMVEAGGMHIESQEIPENPKSLAYLAAALLQIPLLAKQALLEMEQLDQLLSELQILYRREIALLRALASSPGGREERGFSLN